MESILLKFLNARQKHCPLPLDAVSVKWVGGGNVNECFLNAHKKTLDGQFQMVSGWLAIPTVASLDKKQFTQHWWNLECATGRHLDFSPEIEDGAIYIVDNNIAAFALANNSKLSSCVPRSILYNQGEFFTVEYYGNGMKIVNAQELSNDLLFEPYLVLEPQ